MKNYTSLRVFRRNESGNERRVHEEKKSCTASFFAAAGVLSLVLFSVPGIASQYVEINAEDFLDAGSLDVDVARSILRFDIAKPIQGELTSYQMNFESGTWSAISADGTSSGGVLPPSATEGIWIPCVSNPLSFGFCAVGLVISSTLCEMRDQNAHRRAIRSCSNFGGIDSFEAGACGVGASHSCRDFVVVR
ncbi:hypothetical protein HFP89_02040 [Wenzhouxiangella sp. XN79A]|uniref:hypothetical protein n=1 Tax=Wenzhouxiangella sp. XN79A TaxID=2724193 RepID=UPI00144AEE19|nr:hypothetical protein [Wenzhouxiangella sp. XN79A]NKI33945.1 hypothetical protein [Wenzhouxiangella sp. XN79A]